jgi:hypothetical protein
MDPLTLIVGALLALAFFVLGHASGRRHVTVNGQAPQPICGCDHGLNMHGTDGKCHEIDTVPIEWDLYSRPVSWEKQPCGCQKYVGPRPVEELFSTPILPPEVES